MTAPDEVESNHRWPVCGTDEQEAVVRVLRSGKLNYWTGGEGEQFEREYAEYVGQPHAIALANGTVALELALHALGIGPGDEVIVPARTYIATASAVVSRGATPVCADVDRDSQNVTVGSIAERVTPRTKAVIPVHLAGWPCDMPAIIAFAQERGLLVIEDCAQAHGATIDGKQVGSFGDAAAFSFCQDKILTTGGEGGMVLFRDTEAWKKAWSYKDHGKDYDAVHSPTREPGFRWLHRTFGTNWRMTEMQAAIGRVVLRRLENWGAARRRNAAILSESLRNIAALRIPEPPPSLGHARYKWYGFLRPERLAHGWSRDRVILEVNRLGGVGLSGSCGEIYREAAFAGIHPDERRLPVAKELGDTSLMLLVDPTQSDASLDQMASTLHKVLARALAKQFRGAAA